MKPLIKEHRVLAVLFAAYYVGLLTYGATTGASQTIFYAVFVGGGALVVSHLYPRARFSQVVLWGLVVWGLAHMIGGLVETGGVVIYERSLGGGEVRFDKLVHFVGFGFATLAAYELLRQTVGRNAPARAVAVTAAFVGLGIGAVNETIEFIITLLPGESNVGGFSNTGGDLVANAFGVATAAWLAPFLERRWLLHPPGRQTVRAAALPEGPNLPPPRAQRGGAGGTQPAIAEDRSAPARPTGCSSGPPGAPPHRPGAHEDPNPRNSTQPA